jgi:hypothetical protein
MCKAQPMRCYEATTLIEAPPEQVWPVLTDIAAWPAWDSGVTNVDGRLTLRSQSPRPQVLIVSTASGLDH